MNTEISLAEQDARYIATVAIEKDIVAANALLKEIVYSRDLMLWEQIAMTERVRKILSDFYENKI